MEGKQSARSKLAGANENKPLILLLRRLCSSQVKTLHLPFFDPFLLTWWFSVSAGYGAFNSLHTLHGVFQELLDVTKRIDPTHYF